MPPFSNVKLLLYASHVNNVKLTVNIGVVNKPQAKNSKKMTTTACVTVA